MSIFILVESMTVLQGETFLASVEQLAGVGFGHKWYHWKGISRVQLDPVNVGYDLHSDRVDLRLKSLLQYLIGFQLVSERDRK